MKNFLILWIDKEKEILLHTEPTKLRKIKFNILSALERKLVK